MSFSWIPFYKELAQNLLRFKDDRTPLVNWIYGNHKEGRRIILDAKYYQEMFSSRFEGGTKTKTNNLF